METHHLSIVFNLEGLKPLFTMLAQSIWVGAATALVAGVVIMCTKKAGAVIRYRLLTGLMLLFIFGMAVIFITALSTNTGVPQAAHIVMTANDTVSSGLVQLPVKKDFFERVLSFIEANSTGIVFAWFVVILFKCARLFNGLRELHRLKKTNILDAGEWWTGRLNELSASLGIVKKVQLLQSSLAKVPMVIGHLKPLILFPVGVLNALSAAEVEAILLHELAHIRRNDFLTNLVQQVVEILFFFNPGILWVSALVKNERENCCDDIAIAVTNDKKKFINALVAFQEYKTGLGCATAFPGAKNHLLNRVKRIITNNNKTLNNMEKLTLAAGIVVTGLIALAFSPAIPGQEKLSLKNAMSKALIAAGTTPQPIGRSNMVNITPVKSDKVGYVATTSADTNTKRLYTGIIDGKKIMLTEENGLIKEFYIDDKKIPAADYGKYTALIDKVHNDIKTNEAKLAMQSDELMALQEEKLQQNQALEDAAEMKEQYELKKEDARDEIVEMKKQLEAIKKEQVEIKEASNLDSRKSQEIMKAMYLKLQADYIQQQKQFQEKEIEYKKQMQQMRLDQQKYEIKRDSIKAKKPVKVQADAYARPEVNTAPTAELAATPELTLTSRTRVNAAPATAVLPRAPDIPEIKVAPQYDIKAPAYIAPNTTSDEIIRDLERSKIITTRENLTFVLSNNELVVNGVKQPDAIHKSILQKYVRKPGDTIAWVYNSH